MTKSRLLLLTILLIAAVLRLTRLDMAEFKRDEATIATRAMDIVRDGQLLAVGVGSSQGPDNPPLMLYLMALPFALSQDPRLAVALVAALNLAAVLATYLLAKRWFDARVGLIAAWLFAVSPWAVFYGRKMWAQNLPLVTLGFMVCLFLLLVERRPWALIGACVGLAALIGLHLGGLAFVFVLALALLLFPSALKGRTLLLGLFVLLLAFAPYLYHDATHGWPNLCAFFELGGKPAQISTDALRYAAWISSGHHYRDLAGVSYRAFLDSLVNLGCLDLVEMLLLGCGVIYLLLKLRRLNWRGEAPRYVLLLLWLLVPVVLQTRHSAPVYPHYFILLYPVQHLIIAIFVVEGLDRIRARLDGQFVEKGIAAGLVVFLVALGGWQIYLGQTFVSFAAQHNTSGGYGPTLGPTRQSAKAAAAAAADGAQVLVVARGDNPAQASLPAIFGALLPRDLPHRFVDGLEALVFPLGPTVYITTYQVGEATATLQAQTGAKPMTYIDAPGGNRYWVFRRDNASRDDVLAGMTPLDPPLRLANGVELLAYGVDEVLLPDGALPFTLAWWLDGPPPDGFDYHTFAHLADGDGQRWGEHDLTGFAASSWRAGDLVLTYFEIKTPSEPPPGEYWIHLGMYTFPDVVNVPVLDAAGNPASDFVTVGPVSLR